MCADGRRGHGPSTEGEAAQRCCGRVAHSHTPARAETGRSVPGRLLTGAHMPLPGVQVVSIAAGLGHTVVATDSGDVYAWGLNQDSQLGNGGSVAALEVGLRGLAGSWEGGAMSLVSLQVHPRRRGSVPLAPLHPWPWPLTPASAACACPAACSCRDAGTGGGARCEGRGGRQPQPRAGPLRRRLRLGFQPLRAVRHWRFWQHGSAGACGGAGQGDRPGGGLVAQPLCCGGLKTTSATTF